MNIMRVVAKRVTPDFILNSLRKMTPEKSELVILDRTSKRGIVIADGDTDVTVTGVTVRKTAGTSRIKINTDCTLLEPTSAGTHQEVASLFQRSIGAELELAA